MGVFFSAGSKDTAALAPEPAPYDIHRLALAHSQIVDRIRTAEHQFGRKPGSVQLLAVSKRHNAEAIIALNRTGQQAFGENQVQEALAKIKALSHLALEWHFIGPIQSNKTAAIAGHFDWVHSVDRKKILKRLNDQRPAELPPLQVCLQVKLADELAKSGARADDVAELIELASALPQIQVRGLMTLPPASSDQRTQRHWFRQLSELRDTLVARGCALDTLSMGMTNDLEAAIAEGATIVRIGTALFGPRP